MRSVIVLAVGAGLALSGPLAAQTRPPHAGPRPPRSPDAPHSLGKFDDWQAATRGEAGDMICFAFTRPQSSVPPLPGRGDVVLTVTQRAHDRDVVALSAGFAFPTGAVVQLVVDKAEMRFYTRGRSAFSGDGHPVTVAFAGARQAVAKVPGPHGATISDTFSLHGFAAAYAAASKACPTR